MRLMLAMLALCVFSQAFAEVPLSGGIQPSGRPVGGPIRPKNIAVVEPTDNYELQRINYGGYALMGHTTAIFWGARWNNEVYSSEKIEGLDQLYYGFDDSGYSHATDEYRLLPQIFPQEAKLNYSGHIIVSKGLGKPRGDNDDFVAVTREVCLLAETGKIKIEKGVGTSFFPVYLDRRRPQGSSCSMHGYYQFGPMYCPGNRQTGHHYFFLGMFYDLDDDPECDIEDHVTGHSHGLAALANQTASVIADIRTDGAFDTLYDAEWNEVGDKCAWIFEVPFVTLSNGSIWKVQSLWSNAAYEAGTGFPNHDGARGCVAGQ